MDLDHIGSKLANLTMYDVKSLYRQARNYALNVSEIEAKVDEATNDEPWGASSTLMQEIAQATNNFQDFNEIMPTIYRRFMEKEAREWRQIYKALQLLYSDGAQADGWVRRPNQAFGGQTPLQRMAAGARAPLPYQLHRRPQARPSVSASVLSTCCPTYYCVPAAL